MRKGHDLAERRLAHFTELYRSGRWKDYYPDERRFASHMLDVIRASRVWSELLDRSWTGLSVRRDDARQPAE